MPSAHDTYVWLWRLDPLLVPCVPCEQSDVVGSTLDSTTHSGRARCSSPGDEQQILTSGCVAEMIPMKHFEVVSSFAFILLTLLIFYRVTMEAPPKYKRKQQH